MEKLYTAHELRRMAEKVQLEQERHHIEKQMRDLQRLMASAASMGHTSIKVPSLEMKNWVSLEASGLVVISRGAEYEISWKSAVKKTA